MLIDGKKIAAEAIAELKARGRNFSGMKVLGILVGDNAASLSFLRQKNRVAAELGITFSIRKIKVSITEDVLVAKVAKLAGNLDVIGAIVQLPIPIERINTQRVLDAVPYEKDIDCLGERRVREYYNDSATALIAPPAVGTVKRILETLGVKDMRGKRLTVYGFGRLVGKPVAAWGASAGANVTVLRRNSTRVEIAAALGGADIIVTGVGQQNLISVNDVCPGTTVIDFGYPADIDAATADKAGLIVTPTPGGTGPVLVAELFRNLYAIT